MDYLNRQSLILDYNDTITVIQAMDSQYLKSYNNLNNKDKEL